MRTYYDKNFSAGLLAGGNPNPRSSKAPMNDMFIPVMLSKDKIQSKTTNDPKQIKMQYMSGYNFNKYMPH